MYLAQVDRAHFAGEYGRERRDGDGHGCPFVESEGIILIEVRTTTNTDLLSGEGASRMAVRDRLQVGYDGPASRIAPG
jgi:hypothetical protein